MEVFARENQKRAKLSKAITGDNCCCCCARGHIGRGDGG